MNQKFQQIFSMVVFMIFLVVGLQGSLPQASAATDSSVHSEHLNSDPNQLQKAVADLALQYANAMASGKVEEWAALDLGCLDRQQRLRSGASSAKACWDATMAAHRDLVHDETEPGIFGAFGRGTGFGLIHASHQHADFWKDYPPALALSPEIIRETPEAPIPLVKVAKVLETRSAGLVIEKDQSPAKVQKVSVDLSITYPDPFTAPLALLPGEPWWANPVIRKYAPVRNLLSRLNIVGGLKALGYPIDVAVVNEALPNAPVVAEPSTPGILPSSPQWWDREQSQQYFDAGLQAARKTVSFEERVGKFQRLLLLDPKEPQLNAVYGIDLYNAFLKQGLSKGNITSEDTVVREKLAELYWNIQAQTWRQEFTEVAVGHSFAAEAFYQAIPALEIAIDRGQGNEEMQRKIGAFYRWNNDSASALEVHEHLLKNVPSQNDTRRGQLLSEIAWDRVQWLSWNRRYGHPWLNQAREEAEESLKLVKSPIDKIIAAEALVILDSLAVPRDQERLQKHVTVVRTWHDQLSDVSGVWNHLVGNDLVKALIPEGHDVKLPAPTRSPEVLPLETHHTIQDRNFLKTWNFDQDMEGKLPAGFSMGSSQNGTTANWQVEVDSKAPSAPHVIRQTSPCNDDTCFQVLLGTPQQHKLPDIVTYIRQVSTAGEGEAGIALFAKDPKNFYAVTLNLTNKQLSIYHVQHGKPRLLGKGPFKAKKGPWYVLRVQTVNSAHIDHPLLEIYVDGFETQVMASEPLMGGGHVGLITKGDMVAQFDRFGVIEMITSRPMSKPAAY